MEFIREEGREGHGGHKNSKNKHYRRNTSLQTKHCSVKIPKNFVIPEAAKLSGGLKTFGSETHLK